jgi:hypothetical protein
VFTLSACSTVAAGIALAFPSGKLVCELTIIGLTSMIGLVTSIEGIRKPAELWIHERATYYALQDLKRELEFRELEEDPRALASEIFGRMQQVLEASGDKWNRHIVGRLETGQAPTLPAKGGRPYEPGGPLT